MIVWVNYIYHISVGLVVIRQFWLWVVYLVYIIFDMPDLIQDQVQKHKYYIISLKMPLTLNISSILVPSSTILLRKEKTSVKPDYQNMYIQSNVLICQAL